MGFSVSAAAAIIFASMFIAFGAWYGATSNSFERVSEARQIQADDIRETRSSGVEISNASFNSTTGELTVEASNTGSAQFSLSHTSLLVDGRYEGGWKESRVQGDPDTDLWLASEQLTITVEIYDPAIGGDPPDRVKLVAGNGVSDTAEVSV